MQELTVNWQCTAMPCEHHSHYLVLFFVRPELTIPVNVYRDGGYEGVIIENMLSVTYEAVEYVNVVAEKYNVKLIPIR